MGIHVPVDRKWRRVDWIAAFSLETNLFYIKSGISISPNQATDYLKQFILPIVAVVTTRWWRSDLITWLCQPVNYFHIAIKLFQQLVLIDK